MHRLVRHFAKWDAALEHLVDMMRFVVAHIFDLKMNVKMGELRMATRAMPVGGREFLQASGEMLAVLEECRERILGGPGDHFFEFRVAIRVIASDSRIFLRKHGLDTAVEHLLDAIQVADQLLQRPFVGNASLSRR